MSSLQNVLGTATSHDRQRASLEPSQGIRIVLLAKDYSLENVFLDLPPMTYFRKRSDARRVPDSYERFGVYIDVVTNRNLVSSLRREVIVNVFRIDDPRTLSISNYRPDCHLLVGFNSANVLPTFHSAHRFPSTFGPLLAECIGADRYVECSSTNKDKVFEEAVRVVFSANEHKFLDKQLHGMLLNQGTTDDSGEWISVMEEQTKITKLYLTFADFAEDLNALKEEMEVAIQLDTEESNVCQGLEIERVRLSHRKFEPAFSKKSSQPCCCLWYIPKMINEACLYIAENTKGLPFRMKKLPFSQSRSGPINLYFNEQPCESIATCFTTVTKSCLPLLFRSLVIVNCPGVLNLSFLTKLEGLKYLVIVNTEVDKAHDVSFSSTIHDTMNQLVLNNCGLTELPSEIGYLSNLQLLNIASNGITKLPKALGYLKNLRTLLLDHDKILFPPANVLSKSVQDVISFLDASQKEEVENKEAKLIVVGQEGVGKSTLIKAMKRKYWFTKSDPPGKTDGIDISNLHLDGLECKVYDMAGDVEYLNTHSLFLSSKCLYLTVIDLSQIIISKGTRSADHLCRLELWLQTIASQDPSSYVIIVGTHADHSLLSREVLQKHRQLVVHLLAKYRAAHEKSNRETDLECMLCNPDKVIHHLKCSWPSGELEKNNGNTPEIVNCMPHIVGYFEVSGIMKYPQSYLRMSNISVKQLKQSIAGSIDRLAGITSTQKIPKLWLSFRETVREMLSADTDLQQQPVISFTRINSIAMDKEVLLESEVVAMLRFFHSQGTFLWYEDLTEMKDVIIIDPQWLSDQLRTLISHRSSVCSFIRDGIINLADLPTIWPHISPENREKLLDLFRSVRLCFSISETEELFPCNLPVGWPNEDMWPPLPNPSEKQTSLLFLLNFIPPSFFPDLIVEVNKRRPSFACNVQPLYYRFHIVYIIKSQQDATYEKDISEESECMKTQESVILHSVHYELMPYNDSLQISVRGPRPRSILPDVRSMIETVKRRRYPGISYRERLLCPECVIKKVRNPATFVLDEHHDGVCTKGHKVGNSESIWNGKRSSSTIVPSPVRRVVGETLQDHVCPKLFVILPINLEGVSLKDFVLSYIRDGFAVHLLCECPEQWHFVNFPGFRVNKPKEFFKKYGDRVCKVLKVVSTLSIPFKIASSLDPHCKIGAAVGLGASSACEELQSLLDSYMDSYPYLQSSLGSPEDNLKYLKTSSGLQRSELSRFLEVEAKGHMFGPLVCTYVPKHNEWLWLCEEHNRRFETVKD